MDNNIHQKCHTDKTELESWLESKGQPSTALAQPSRPGRPRNLHNNDDATDYDNVTTISKASKNPYRVPGISQRSSPREIYDSYKRRLREAERSSSFGGKGGDEAFADVGNAYRRIKADMKRQEMRKERRRMEEQQQQQNTADGRKGKKKKSKRKKQHRSSSSDEESDAKSRRENIDTRLKDHRELVQGLFAKDDAEKSERNNEGA